MKQCYFCQKGFEKIDYKEIDTIKKFISSQFKILPRRKTLTCAKHQRSLATAIKRARVMALLPFCPKR
jgi:small subunit ribosomal protein S18